MESTTAGLIGGLIGSFIGILGGAFGTWMSIRNTQSPRERQMAIRFSVVAWVVALLAIVAALLIPQPWTMLAFVPIWVGLPFFIITYNRRTQQIRAEEAGASTESDNQQ